MATKNSTMGDFLGFSFDGIHSSRLGIKRVSDSDRYSEIMVPEFEDKIISVPGKDGSYYFGSNYSNKPISISIAYDSMTESQFRQFRKLFGTNRICSLVFDERPYKVYMVKISTPPQLNYVCFDEPKKELTQAREGIRVIDRENGRFVREEVTPYVYTGERERIYKGEGTIEFVSMSPFAREQFKILDFYGDFDFYDGWGNRYRNNPRSIGELEERKQEAGHNQDATAPENIIVELGNSLTEYTNVKEWAPASGILSYEYYKKNNIDLPIASTQTGYNAIIPLYNPGDIDTPYYLFIPYSEYKIKELNEGDNPNELGLYEIVNEDYILTTDTTVSSGKTYYIKAKNLQPKSGSYIEINQGNSILRLSPFEAKTSTFEENGIMINTNAHLIEGVVFDYKNRSWKITGNLYNEYIITGDFQKIKGRDWSMDDIQYSSQIQLNCMTALDSVIYYNYLYY